MFPVKQSKLAAWNVGEQRRQRPSPFPAQAGLLGKKGYLGAATRQGVYQPKGNRPLQRFVP